jgi:hypothetical protein
MVNLPTCAFVSKRETHAFSINDPNEANPTAVTRAFEVNRV